MGLEGNLSGGKGMLESKEVGIDTSSSFLFLLGCVGLGGEQAEQKLEEEKKEEEKKKNIMKLET